MIALHMAGARVGGRGRRRRSSIPMHMFLDVPVTDEKTAKSYRQCIICELTPHPPSFNVEGQHPATLQKWLFLNPALSTHEVQANSTLKLWGAGS